MAGVVALPFSSARPARPGLCGLIVLSGDFLAVLTALSCATLIPYSLLGGYEDLGTYFSLLPLLALFPAGYALMGLYPGIAHHPVRELRQLSSATTLIFVLLATLLFLTKEGQNYSRLAFLGGWLGSLVAVPLVRALSRLRFAAEPWWGYPVAVLGTGETARKILANLQAHPEMGLTPVAVFQPGATRGGSLAGIPILGDLHAAPLYARRLELSHAVVALPGVSGAELARLLETHVSGFAHVYLAPGLDGFSSLAIQTQDICDSVTLELRRSLLLPGSQWTKRVIDAVLSLALLILLSPVLAAIALAIRLESPGKALFCHKRIGHAGRQFRMWKFRTMYANGAEILTRHLADHPEEREQWEAVRKLRNDPRVTRLGRLLRKTSLDEVPQLWNVLRGEMSLVGPRPIVNEEIPKYGDFFGLYCRVMPGLTGMWQVSGRSDTDYPRRVELDSFYVRNWSPWLDVYLLARTVKAVIRREGAY